jgi:predicted RNA-binding Zn-ribbon protein involved in translation (DUF1610 family)
MQLSRRLSKLADQLLWWISGLPIVRRLVGSMAVRAAEIDPERFYPQNIGRAFGLPHYLAALFCEDGVRRGAFSRHVALECPSCGRLLSSAEQHPEDGEDVVCLNCEFRDGYEPPSEFPARIYYSVANADEAVANG